MKHGLWLRNSDSTDVAQLVEYGVAAETAGWDGVFVSDSLPFSEYPDPWIVLAGIAARTEDIRLGTWIVPVPRRQPWQIANEVTALDQLSDGRMMLGAGLGNSDEYEAFGRPYNPRELGDRFDEALDVITGLWQGEPFTYDGDHFTLEDAEVNPTPVQQPRVPILLGCWWPNKKPFDRGARWDGIMPNWPTLTGSREGPRGEQATGSLEQEVRDMLEYYHGLTDDPGEIVMPTDPPGASTEYVELCRELEVSWLLTLDLDADPDDALQQIRDGPPEVHG